MVYVIGDKYPRGTYIQKIRVKQTITINYGRSQKQKEGTFPKGTYVLVGSALGDKGAGSLPLRLTRHARRSDNSKHPVFDDYLELYNLDLEKLNKMKTLHWHPDYLLNSKEAEVLDAIIIQSAERLEEKIEEEARTYYFKFSYNGLKVAKL